MAEEAKVFKTWEECISNFILERKNNKIVDLLSKKDAKKSDDDCKQAVLIQLNYFLCKDNNIDKQCFEEVLKRKNSGDGKVTPLEFSQKKYCDLIGLTNEENTQYIKKNYEGRLSEINNTYNIVNWLNDNSFKAFGVGFSTHVAKLTHSSVQGSSFFVVKSNQKYKLLTTNTLTELSIDNSSNATLIPISSFLNLEVNGKKLADYISEKDNSPFQWITSNENTIERWIDGFSAVFSQKTLSSHSLLKQVYFPLDKRSNKYHLLCIVKSSSLAHVLFRKLDKKENRKPEHYSSKIVNAFPNNAQLSLTASRDAHKNVSSLHVERNGRLFLLSTQPPTWQRQFNVPINQKTVFDRGLPIQNFKADIDYLRDFLLRFESIELSIKDPKRKKWIESWVGNIVDELLFHISNIHQLPAGWSAEENKLREVYQYLLDPYRSDETFQVERKNNDWQAEVCNDFSHWLNRQLIGKEKQFTPQQTHTRMWVDLLKGPLREFNQNVEMDKIEVKEGAV